METVKNILLKDKPSKDAETLFILDLYSEENILGEENFQKKVKEAEISVGKFHISFLSDGNSMFPAAIINPDRSKWDLYLLYIPYTIHEAPRGSYYEEVKFMIRLDSCATAFDLLPKSVYMNENVEKEFSISPEWKFMECGTKIGEAKYKISFEKLRPIIKVFGMGESEFYWIYKNPRNQEDFSGQKHALIILEVPKNTKSINGNIFCEAVIEKQIFGIWTHKQAKITKERDIIFNLHEATPLTK